MIVRSAGRRQRRHTARILSACFAQLNLPWLAPAQLRWSATQASGASQAPARLRPRSSSQTRPTPAQSRQLATATDQYTLRHTDHYAPPGYSIAFRNPSQDKNIPWDLSSQNRKAPLSSIRPYDDPIIINTSIQNSDQTIKVTHGVQGTAYDLLQHLHTALQVGRLSRAQAIIDRLGELCTIDSTELLHAHTAYLEESLRALALHGRGKQGEKALEEMQRWFEVEVRQKGVTVDAKMLVVMVRASIKALTGAKRDRTIRRYTDMARALDEDVYDEVLESEDYDDNEFTILGRATYDDSEGHEKDEHIPEQPTKQATPGYLQRPDILPMEELPEVAPTAQRGEGLKGIKRVMQGFTESPALPASAPTDQQREQALKRQRIMEEASVEVAVDRWRNADEELRKIGIHTSMQSKPISALMWQWYQAMLPALEAELAECKKLLSNPGRNDHDRYYYGPYLEVLPLDKIAANTILFTMTKIASRDRHTGKYTLEVRLPALTTGLARAIEQECKVDASARKDSNRRMKQRLRNHSKYGGKSKKLSKADQSKQALLATLEWPADAKVKFGAMLASKLIETAQLPVTRLHPRTREKITQMQPAFLHRFKFEKGKKIGLLVPNPALTEKIESEPVGSLIAKRMPMVVDPQPWTGWSNGGYVHYSNTILRLQTGDKSAKDYFMAAHNRGDMNQIYAGLTALGEVPWKVQHDVFKVQLEAWNSGEAIAKLAPLQPKLEVPPEPEPSTDPMPRRKWLAEMRDVENRRTGLHSQRCFQNFQMEIARTMVNETLYFPHNMDFRGRAYPIPPYLNHMGADNVRGWLVFAKGKELGENGLRWLKIHMATVAGHDKASMSERVEYTMNHLDDIRDSARNPLGGRRWWAQSEDPWQTLAACFELTAALDSPDPTRFVSHLPIQQDGTCNGLQHYAALGGDKIGAAQVNLEPGDRPADVYTAVAEAVKEDVRRDASQGNPIALKLDGHLTRKCVKQPVMTNVYGVTWFGAKEQVQKQLEVIFPEVRKFDDVNYAHMSQYIATKIFKSLGTMFGGAQAIQHWLGQCADRISTSITPEQIEELAAPLKPTDGLKKAKVGRKKKAVVTKNAESGTSEWDRNQQKIAKPLFKSTVVWTTPLRLPVVQPYRSARARTVNTSLQGISLQEPKAWHPVSKRKQLQAFPPNFIHSLDATHMLLSALKCKELGITFASVHDSFWTHACDVQPMSAALRDSFVEMHSDNIIGRLREEFQMRYQGYMYLASVLAKSPVGEKITALRKKGNKSSGSSELALEAKRMQLLESDDAEQRAEGKAMVTPGSILASEGDDSAFAVPAEIAGQQLGSIPDSADFEAAQFDPDESDFREITAEADEGVVGGSVLGTATEEIEAGSQGSSTPDVGESGKPKKVYHRKLFVWMPLTFPDIPPKGEFDVRKIRESKYFFH
ncbi:DNA-directed RNA polymerase [Vermiconidia calcicola]|uniref:DNA-directed RNA polymerase n=1 Tax=Vermiconidia calcicola TaxID=1690605 RepID=A0ACC3NDH3_9PEZI|nr:DNA-directed RNA polymerase [Vermiconidia calcicola]